MATARMSCVLGHTSHGAWECWIVVALRPCRIHGWTDIVLTCRTWQWQRPSELWGAALWVKKGKQALALMLR